MTFFCEHWERERDVFWLLVNYPVDSMIEIEPGYAFLPRLSLGFRDPSA